MNIPEIKAFYPFFQMSEELMQFNPTFAYYIKAYALQKTYTIYKGMTQQNPNFQLLGSYLNQQVNAMTQLKNSNQQLFQDKEANKQQLTDFVMRLFFESDTSERDGVVTKELVKNFQVCSKYFEVLQYFGPLSAEQEEKKKYSKVKAVEILKKLKNPELCQKRQNEEEQFDKQMQEISDKVNQQQTDQDSQKQLSQSQQSVYPMRQNMFSKLPKYIENKPQSQNQQDTIQQPDHNQQSLQFVTPGAQIFVTPKEQTQKPEQDFSQKQLITPQIFNTPQDQLEKTQKFNPNSQQQQVNNTSAQMIMTPQGEQNLKFIVTPQEPFQEQPKKFEKLTALQMAERRSQAKKLIENALSELDYKKYSKTSENLEKALNLVRQLEQQ